MANLSITWNEDPPVELQISCYSLGWDEEDKMDNKACVDMIGGLGGNNTSGQGQIFPVGIN